MPDNATPPAPKEKERDPAKRLAEAKLWMAWWGLVVLAVGFVSFVLLAGWRARRLARHRVGPSRLGKDDWYENRLNPPLSDEEDDPP